MDVAIATCAGVPDLDEDGAALLAALAAEGLNGVPAVWDAPVDWAAFDAVVVRSTWDYAPRLEEFLDWVRAVPVPLFNPAEMIVWNTDKRYLKDLQAAGVPTVQTVFLENDSLPAWDDFVVKPTVSAGCRDTARFRGSQSEAAMGLVRAIRESGRTAMVQPYVDGVDAAGETALLYFGGQFSHAICKAAMLEHDQGVEQGLYRPETITRTQATAAQLKVGAAALAVAGDPLYARVDVVPGPDGPQVLELELTEPSVFLGYDEGAAARFAAAIAGRLAQLKSGG